MSSKTPRSGMGTWAASESRSSKEPEVPLPRQFNMEGMRELSDHGRMPTLPQECRIHQVLFFSKALRRVRIVSGFIRGVSPGKSKKTIRTSRQSRHSGKNGGKHTPPYRPRCRQQSSRDAAPPLTIGSRAPVTTQISSIPPARSRSAICSNADLPPRGSNTLHSPMRVASPAPKIKATTRELSFLATGYRAPCNLFIGGKGTGRPSGRRGTARTNLRHPSARPGIPGSTPAKT